GHKHPNIIATKSELKTAKNNTHKQIRRIVSGIKKEYEVARANERAVERELASSKNEARGINKKEYKLRILERDVSSNRQLYDMFLTRFKETNVSDDMQTTIARVVDPSVVSYIAHKPKKKLIVGIALVLGLFISVLLAFLLEYLDATFKSVEDVEKRLGMTVLGILPLLKDNIDDRSVKTHFIENGKSNYSESIRTIRTGVMLSGLDNPHKIILVTSSVPSEGKSSLACNLAMAVGQMEKVLLIDADMRRPTIGRTFGFSPATPGLSNLVAGTEPVEQCINKLEGTDIDIMTSGIVPPNPLELLSSKKFEEILMSLSEQYDRVIIDSAPTQTVSDSMMLSQYASAVIYVVKSDETPYHVAEQGIKRMHEVKAPLLGVVLNKVDVSKSQSYYGYYGYGQGYGTENS
ncbi:MAG: polysaccharide biosynthesis tyrosine autokinase, partial [Flavobacteriales bacterium]|nr:polysaccharide biosynthesis tyrosine autokinase [Flavobacteriales bacterium]